MDGQTAAAWVAAGIATVAAVVAVVQAVSATSQAKETKRQADAADLSASLAWQQLELTRVQVNEAKADNSRRRAEKDVEDFGALLAQNWSFLSTAMRLNVKPSDSQILDEYFSARHSAHAADTLFQSDEASLSEPLRVVRRLRDDIDGAMGVVVFPQAGQDVDQAYETVNVALRELTDRLYELRKAGEVWARTLLANQRSETEPMSRPDRSEDRRSGDGT